MIFFHKVVTFASVHLAGLENTVKSVSKNSFDMYSLTRYVVPIR